jgi:hypothetical protein
MKQTASMDFFTVPTATFRVLFVFIVLSHDRRRVMHCNVTDHPSEEWTAQQIREAFPWEAPKYLIRDRDAIFGGELVALTKSMGIEEVVTAPRSPWQNPYVERLIGSIRRECLDHVIVWNATSLRRILRSYFQYYEKSRTHLALAKDAPQPRAVYRPENGRMVAIPQVGGLHHRTNGALFSRSFTTSYWVRSVPSPRLRLVLSFPVKNKLTHPRGGPFGAMNRPAEFHLRFRSVR